MQETLTYTFREYITKYDVQFNADDTQVTYREQKNYTYDPTGSTAPQGWCSSQFALYGLYRSSERVTLHRCVQAP